MPTQNETEQSAGARAPLRVLHEPEVYLVGRQVVDDSEIQRFLDDHQATWSTDTEVGAEALAEAGGRLCYMSFGKGRKTNREFLEHIVEVGHGSVLEHAVWNFVFTGVSRSLTHELIRHRAGFGYSQLSQRYVNESEAPFIQPDCIAADPALDALWREAVDGARRAYDALVAGLERKFSDVEDRTLRRKMARQAARSVLPNATETRIFVTANARALRHFIEMRGSVAADEEIRKLALKVLAIMQGESPNLFGDYRIETLPDGTRVASTPHGKV
ncbi:MAG: FAD-dependent thymidylate synthase [Candidatus Eisenbacteria bacterium]|nr:FAD-dependent thymidylate synthase [Candidatus Eisenbacteria bacterium]